MNIIKIVGPMCLVLMTSCLATENATSTELEQQLNVQKREKQYLIEDDPNEHEGPHQKRDERQSSKVNNNLDANANSKRIRLQTAPNILKASKQAMKPKVLQKPTNRRMETTSQRKPTKNPVILKTTKVVPGAAHAIRLKMLENQNNESKSNCSNENTLYPNAAALPSLLNGSVPYFTIEDRKILKTETCSSPNNVDNEIPHLESNGTLNRDGKENLGNDGKNPPNKDSIDSPNDDKDDQVTSYSNRKVSLSKNKENVANSKNVQNPVQFYVDEPAPIPPSIRRQMSEYSIASQSNEVTPNKPKEISIVIKGKNNPKNDETEKKDSENGDMTNDPDVVRISNGTHLISIKKLNNLDKIENIVSRDGEEITIPTEERMVNPGPPKPKPIADQPEKHSFTITEKSNIGKINVGTTGFAFRDNKNKEEKEKHNCNKLTNRNEQPEEKSPVAHVITLQPAIPTTVNEGNPEPWSYLQNQYYPSNYDQYRRNYALANGIPNINGPEIVDPRNYGVNINPYIYNPPKYIDPYPTEVALPYYPNGNPRMDTDSNQYPHNPCVHGNQAEIENNPCPEILPGSRPGSTLDRLWRGWKDVGVKIRNGQSIGSEMPMDFDARRSFDDINDGTKVDIIGKMMNPYATSSLPITINGALVYPDLNIRCRYMR